MCMLLFFLLRVDYYKSLVKKKLVRFESISFIVRILCPIRSNFYSDFFFLFFFLCTLYVQATSIRPIYCKRIQDVAGECYYSSESILFYSFLLSARSFSIFIIFFFLFLFPFYASLLFFSFHNNIKLLRRSFLQYSIQM